MNKDFKDEKKKWPNGARCAVSFSFDVDIDSSWRLKLKEAGMDENEPVVRSIGQYGLSRGVPRILALLKKYSIKGTFFVPGIVAKEYEDVIRKIKNDGHEIAHHGFNHVPPTSLTEDEQEREIVDGKKALEDALGVTPIGYRAPGEGMGFATL
ncbi:MAG: polysaccharide deacetylase family protein, partial [Conexivisphaerales archaeon]